MLGLKLVEVIGTDEVALQVLPSALVSIHIAGVKVSISDWKAAEARLALAHANAPPAIAALAVARVNAVGTSK
jgi:hypothetical protein